MNVNEMFHEIMTKEDTMALATSVEGCPNVRVVNFGYNPEDKNSVYFTTFPGNQKIQEFEMNNLVACCILPHKCEVDGQVRFQGRVKRSTKQLSDVEESLSKNAPEYKELLTEAEDVLILFEIEVKEVSVTIGMTDAEVLTL